MGKLCFSKAVKFFAFALLGAATAIAAVAVLSAPAAADPSGGDGGGFGSLKNWDTDNLRFGSYTSASFRVPSHDYGRLADRYSHDACDRGGVADGFYQTKVDVNDFPVLDYDTNEFKVWGSSDLPCDKFVQAQERMVSEAAANGGHWLDSQGILRKGSLPNWIATRPASLTYGSWSDKGVLFQDTPGASTFISGKRYYYAYSTVSSSFAVTSDAGYQRRLDVFSADAPAADWAIYPNTATLEVVWGRKTANPTGRYLYSGLVTNAASLNSVSKLGKIAMGTGHSRPASGYLSSAYSVGGGSVGICPAGFHPRGEDSVGRIGNTTGRTLSHLDHAEGQIADRFWCRSDLRFLRKLYPYTRPGVTLHPQAQNMSATEAFYAYGRVNCFYTANLPAGQTDPAAGSGTTGLKDLGDNAFGCEYPYHPLPLCDPDPDNGSNSDWRAYTAPEIANAGTVTQPFNKTAGTDCANAPADPPQQAGFTADACVTASLEIYENRIVGSDTEPGVPASDRTLVVAAGRTAWDLDVTSPHPLTASPPRDQTAGIGDPDGCADGSEDRADHASSPAGAARKQSPAPSYAASDSTDTAAPPNDADGDIDYSGAVKNMAHRYASRVAENTCAAKRAEASLRLALLEAEEKLYKDWMERYEVWAKGKKDAFSNWRPTNYPSGTNPNTSSSLSVHPTFYSFKHAKRSKSRLDYADAMSTMYETRETDAGAVAGRSLTKPTVGSSWCGDPAGFVKTYSDSVTRLKTAAANAITAGTAQSQPSDGPTSSSAPNKGSAGVVDASKLSEGAARVSAEWGTSYTWAYADTTGRSKPHSGSSGCWQAGTRPTFGGSDVIYTPGAACIYKAAVPEVLASGTASSVTYASYTFTLSGGGWTRTITVPAATRAAVCSSWQTSSCYASPSTHPSHDGYVSLWNGSLPSVTGFPSTTGSPGKSVSSPVLSLLLGKYYPSHADRTDLKHATAQTRDTAAADLGTLAKTTATTITPTAFSNLAVPASNPATDTEETAQRNAVKTAAETYQNSYTQAYDAAYTQATGHMSGTSWNSFDWRYQKSTLAWGNYQEDPATTYSASTATPRDGTGCDLIAVVSDGTVSVEATRLDYETSSYGKGSVYSTRTDTQRTCKIRRTRTPELILKYQPSRPSGTDTSKAVSSFHVDYQPTPAAERFKLYDEAEVFAVKTSLADRAPVLCYQPGEALVAHVAAKGIDAVNKAVFRHASGFAGGNKKHCYRHPTSAQLGTPPKPAFVFFDDTAHSAMASVNVVWQQPNPKIVSKLGSEDDLKMMANTVSLVASPAVAYDDATRTSRFYGTYYTFPTDNSVNSPSGWDITGHPSLTLASTFTQHQVQAKDTAAKTPTTHTMVFKFVDCVFGIEDVAFVDNIASPYALLSDENGVVPAGWKQTYDSDPHNSSTWYYPAFSTYEGARRLDGRRDSNGNPITYGRNTQGGFGHPSYDLENTAADGIGWGIVYEDKVGKQQPVWAVYAPPVPGDNTQLAIEVCGANNLGTGGANPTAATGTPAARA